LLEEAAYWDWALATGVGSNWVARRAAAEYQRLAEVARTAKDEVWLGWVLPPGSRLVTVSSEGIPAHAGDAVKRIGNGLNSPVLAPLMFRGLFATNTLLDILTHGNFAAAQVMAPGGGEELSEPLAAAVVHVASAGAAAVTLALTDPNAAVASSITDAALQVAACASAIHHLSLGAPLTVRRPSKPGSGSVLDIASDIRRMHAGSAVDTGPVRVFLERALDAAVLAGDRLRGSDAIATVIWSSFRMSVGQMRVLEGVLDGTLARALLPLASRALFEDGARWGWVRNQALKNPSGGSLRGIVSDAKQHVIRTRDRLFSEAIPPNVVHDLLGPALDLAEANPGDHPLPAVGDLLADAYSRAGSPADWAVPMYSVLSQFVHATPIAALHLQRDTFTSITAPTFAIAVEAACRGFLSIAAALFPICCDFDEELRSAVEALFTSLAPVTFATTRWHMIG
jgi:hypothetical protein